MSNKYLEKIASLANGGELSHAEYNKIKEYNPAVDHPYGYALGGTAGALYGVGLAENRAHKLSTNKSESALIRHSKKLRGLALAAGGAIVGHAVGSVFVPAVLDRVHHYTFPSKSKK